MNEAHHLKAMEDITVRECFNLSDLHQPPTDTKTEWLTKGGTFHTSSKCMTNFILNEFYESKVIEWILHVTKTSGPQWYHMTIGHDLMSQLGKILNFDIQTITWDENPLSKWKNTKTFWSNINSPINEFYWHEETYEWQALNDASSHLTKILDAKHKPTDLKKIARNCDYLTDIEQNQLFSLLHQYQHLFNGSLDTWNAKPCDIEFKPDAKPYHSKPFLVQKNHEATLKIELECLTKAGVLKKSTKVNGQHPLF